MTIRHLLTHTAGLGYPFTSSTILAIQTKTGKDPKELPLLFDPGTKWNYSPGPAVLGDLVEKLSGQSLEAWDQAESSVRSGWWTLHTPLRRRQPSSRSISGKPPGWWRLPTLPHTRPT
jgi:hypothetical protein